MIPKGYKTNTTNTQLMTFKIPRELNQKLGEIALREERNKAWLIRKAIKKMIEEKSTKEGVDMNAEIHR